MLTRGPRINSPVLVIRTGGTIDAAPYHDPYSPPERVSPLLPDESLVLPALRALKNTGQIDEYKWRESGEARMVVDSNDFETANLRTLAGVIKQYDHPLVIITHGTDAIANNARALGQLLHNTDKVIIFVGAIVPLSMDIDKGTKYRERHGIQLSETYRSDGVPALITAYSQGQDLVRDGKKGVFVVGSDLDLDGRMTLFPAEVVEKDRSLSLQRQMLVLRRDGIGGIRHD